MRLLLPFAATALRLTNLYALPVKRISHEALHAQR